MASASVICVGDSVVVRAGVVCPDDRSVSLAGWQGRVGAVHGELGSVWILWDSVSLCDMPDRYVRESEEADQDWASIVLPLDAVTAAEPRDTPQQREAARRSIAEQHRWDFMHREHPAVAEVLGEDHPGDVLTGLRAWERHFAAVLPFTAEIVAPPCTHPARVGARVEVEAVAAVDDYFGLLVRVRQGRTRFAVPLGDVAAANGSASVAGAVGDYAAWMRTCPRGRVRMPASGHIATAA